MTKQMLDDIKVTYKTHKLYVLYDVMIIMLKVTTCTSIRQKPILQPTESNTNQDK